MIDENDKKSWNDRPEPYLTRDEFVMVYDRCGKFLHEDSPYKTDKEIQNEYEQVWIDIGKWGQLIINLLFTHTIRLYNQKDLFYISMGTGDNPPHGNIFTKVTEEQTNG